MTTAALNRRDKAPMPPTTAPATPPFNVAKLFDLRERHNRLHEEYQRIAERARTARAEVAHTRHAALSDPTNETQLAMIELPAEKLAAIPTDELRDAGVDLQLIRRIVHGQALAEALKAEARALAATLADSRRLLDSLNNYAARWPGAV